MVTSMTSDSPAFQSAARRLDHGKPITFTLETIVYPSEDEIVAQLESGAEVIGTPTTVTFMVNPMTDVVTLGVAFGAVLTSVNKLSDPELSQEAKLALIDAEVPKIRAAMGKVLTPPSRTKWERHGVEFSVPDISSLIQRIMRELSGMDPTRQASSADGSPPTTGLSTDGHSPTGSTPPESPSPGA